VLYTTQLSFYLRQKLWADEVDKKEDLLEQRMIAKFCVNLCIKIFKKENAILSFLKVLFNRNLRQLCAGFLPPPPPFLDLNQGTNRVSKSLR
jgi:hypothetical protein